MLKTTVNSVTTHPYTATLYEAMPELVGNGYSFDMLTDPGWIVLR